MVQIRCKLTKNNASRIDRLGHNKLVDSSHIVGARAIQNFIKERRSRKQMRLKLMENTYKSGDLLRLRVYRPKDFRRLEQLEAQQ